MPISNTLPRPREAASRDCLVGSRPGIALRPYIIVAAGAALFFLPFFRVYCGHPDEGTLVEAARRVLEGQVPFRDFFEVMGPGSFYWLALFFKIFGVTWLATRVCLLVTTSATAVVLYYLARRLRCGAEALPVVVFVAVSWHSWDGISHHLDSNLFGLLSFAAFLHWVESRRPWMLFLAGAAAAVTTWIMLPKGALLCLSLLLLLLLRKWRALRLGSSLGLFSGGYLFVIAPVIAFFWRAGGLPALIYANLTWPLHNYGEVNTVPYGFQFQKGFWDLLSHGFSTSFPPLVSTGAAAFLSLPFLAVMALPLILLFFAVRSRRAAFTGELFPYWLVGTAFWISEIHRKDVTHIVFGSPILILLAFYLCRKLGGNFGRRAVTAVAFPAVALAALHPLITLSAGTRTVTPHGTFYEYSRDPVLDFLSAHIAPGEDLFVYPYGPQYYFLAGAKNPTRYSILMYHYNTDAQFRDAVQSLESNHVRYVAWDRAFPVAIKDVFPNYLPPSQQQIVEPYLIQHYRVIGESPNGYQFLERKQ